MTSSKVSATSSSTSRCLGILSVSVLLLAGTAACSKARHESMADAAPLSMNFAGRAESGAQVSQVRMIIRSASQEVEVEDILVSAERTKDLVERLGGHVEASTVSEKTGNIEVRVPSKGLETAMNQIATIGDEKSRSITGEDVTGEYVDLQARLKNNLALRDRLKALLKQAKDVKDVLQVEVELNRLQSEIDAQEARIKTIDKQVDLSRLSVTLNRERTLGPVGWVGYGVGWFIQKLVFWD